MSDKQELPIPWPEFLSEVDKSLSKPVEIHCLGGFILTVLYGVPRTTGDLDYITVIPGNAYSELEQLAGRDSTLARRHKVYFQHAGGITDLPEDYEERLVDLNLGLKNLRLRALEPYDLVLSKLSRNNPKDRDDVKYLAAKLNLSFAALYERFTVEMKPWVANPDRHDSTLNVVWRDYFKS